MDDPYLFRNSTGNGRQGMNRLWHSSLDKEEVHVQLVDKFRLVQHVENRSPKFFFGNAP